MGRAGDVAESVTERHATMRVRACRFGVLRIKSQAFKAIAAIFGM
jgi:hypothetical protein